MSNIVFTTAVLALLGQVPPPPTPYPPDESDLLRGAEQHPMINLLLDVSGSMSSSSLPTPCTHYATNYGGAQVFNTLNKNQMMEAALTGCRTANDGVLDRWSSRASFAVRFFGDNSGDNTTLEATFGASHGDLEDAVRRADALGNTPMSAGLVAAARDFNDILTSGAAGGSRVRSLQCRRNFVLLLSDGEPNGGDGFGDSACNGTTVNVPSNEPWRAARYMMNSGDMLCSVDDVQTIGTYTLGFGRPGDFNPAALTDIATEGQGRYFYASNVDSLNRAFEQIILSIAERAAVYGGGGTVQRQGLFSGSTNYLASYRTVDGGAWVGNLKRVCVTPPILPRRGDAGETRYDTTSRDCMLIAIDGARPQDPQTLVPNPRPLDQYRNSRALESDVGGAGQILRDRIQNGVWNFAPSRPRDIFTYFPEEAGTGYVRLDLPSLRSGIIEDSNLWIPSGDTWKIVNRLNGFSYDNFAGTGVPTGFARWPMGDSVHSSPVLVRYAADCNAARQCFVVMPTNNGVVHIIDAFSGEEASALVPGELWRPSDLTHHRLADLERQPTFETTRRHYIDGPTQLFHRDADGDGVIEAGDIAYLIFGLGRGGRAYYSMDVSRGSRLNPGFVPPVYPISGIAGTAFEELRDTWSNPWLGRVDFAGTPRNVAIFATGHIAEHDRPMELVPRRVAGPSDVRTQSQDCHAVAAQNGLPPVESCELTVPALFNPGLDIPVGPFTMPDAIAYRVHFRRLSLAADDRVYVTDGVERWASVVGDGGATSGEEPLSAPLDGGWSAWVYGPEFYLRLVSGYNRPIDFEIDRVEYITSTRRPDVEHYPSVFAVALDGPDGWNTTAGAQFNGARNMDSVMLRITRDCSAVPPADRARCIDASTNGSTVDAVHMTCPISTEVSVVSFSNELRLYWGDECGQIFVATNPTRNRDRAEWTVRRLAHLSWGVNATAPSMANQNVALGLSRDVRKIFRRLDIVASTCPGQRVYAVYFGTGDVQRPLARAANSGPQEERYLRNASLAPNGRDIMGVIYDYGSTRHVTQQTTNFFNATSVNTVPQIGSQVGWYVELAASEKMLRDPLVFQNVAYFKTFQPGNAATECEAGSGTDRTYAMNSCNAEAIVDANNNRSLTFDERVTSSGSEDIGPDPFVLTPPGAPPIVVASGPMGGGGGGRGVFQRAMSVRPRIYNWRLPR